MRRSLDIQTFGIVIVITAYILAELSAWLLIACPSCRWAWYLNLGPFRIFEAARVGPLPVSHVFAPASLPVALIILSGLLVARKFQLRFLIALAANLSFGLAASLAYIAFSRFVAHAGIEAETLVLIGLMLASSFAAFVASHASFLVSIKSERAATDRELSQV